MPLARLRQRLRNHWLVGAELLTLGAALLGSTPGQRSTALYGLAALAFWGWLSNLRRAHLIVDTPTARIGSVAQGYAELRGRGKALAGTPLYSPLTGLPVLWYRLRIEARDANGRWRLRHEDESDASFLLTDASGEVVVDPEGADKLVRRKDVTLRGDERLTQHALLANDAIYVIGEFASLGSIAPDIDEAAQVRELLEHWKRDRHALLARFDLDGNGEIDMNEWALARRQARREVLRTRDEAMRAPEVHLMRRPADGRLYLISDLDPTTLARRFRGIAVAQAVLFLAALSTAADAGGLLARLFG